MIRCAALRCDAARDRDASRINDRKEAVTELLHYVGIYSKHRNYWVCTHRWIYSGGGVAAQRNATIIRVDAQICSESCFGLHLGCNTSIAG